MSSLPPSGGFLEAIRQSSRELRISSKIFIPPENIKRLLLSSAFTTSFKRVSKLNGLTFPLNFSSHLEELNFISVLSLLNFASGYRVDLHARTGRGAWDSIRGLLIGLYISSVPGEEDLLSAYGLRTLQMSKIAEMMGITLHIERPHETIPGVTVGELGGPLYDVVKLITSVLNETGQILVESGYANLGLFVAEALQQGGKALNSSGSEAAVEVIIEKLVRAFPAFQDMSEVNARPIYCFKKALFLIHAITIRFGSLSPPPFPIPDTTRLPVFSDNVLPSLLIHLRVIDLSLSSLSNLFPGSVFSSEESLKALLRPLPLPSPDTKHDKTQLYEEGPFTTTSQSYTLRASAIDACELIVEAARTLDVNSFGEGEKLSWINEITLPELDMWIWAVAKDRPDYRALPRFASKDTVYF